MILLSHPNTLWIAQSVLTVVLLVTSQHSRSDSVKLGMEQVYEVQSKTFIATFN